MLPDAAKKRCQVEKLLAEPFARVSYTEAIEILKKHEKKAGFGEKVRA